METSNSSFQEIRSRELNGFRVRKRPYVSDVVSDFDEVGAIAVEHCGEKTPPLAVSFCKTSRNSHILAVSDEDGYISLFDTRRKFASSAAFQENAEKARVCDWAAHHSAVFDVCWIKEDSQILTVSGDQTMKVWDSQKKKCIGFLTGHTGSVKSMCSHPTNPDIIVSGSRDGSFALWDLRTNSTSKVVHQISVVRGAHLASHAKRARHGITSVLYLKVELSIATAGAIDSVLKFWDTRSMKSAVAQTGPPKSTDKERRLHGISSWSQDLNGVFLSASCMDNRIYLYIVLHLEKGPIKCFSGSQIESFYVKSAICPDASYILSGSSDGNAYIWKVDKPYKDPITLRNHDGEVTAVDWCSCEFGKIATASDDLTVRLWNTENNDCSSKRSPSSFVRRVMAIPTSESEKLLMNEPPQITKLSGSFCFSNEVLPKSTSNPIVMPKTGTPEVQRKRVLSDTDSSKILEMTPEAALKSPSSVLNPPQ